MSPSIDFEKMIVDIKATIRDALFSLEKSGQKICFIISEKKEMIGTLSDGDIRRALLQGADINTPVKKVMNRNFIWTDKTESRMNVLDVMKARKINVVPILDGEKRIVGIHTLYGLLGSEPKPNVAFILAGGKGERLKPLTENLPKPMLTVAGKPILERIIHHLIGFGITDFIISVNYLKDSIIEYFKDGERFGCHIEYLVEKEPLGTAGSLSLLKRKIKEPMLILNGDLVTQVDISDMLNFHNTFHCDITVGVYDYFHEVPFGVVKTKKLNVVDIEEKPVESWLVASGIYVISPKMISYVPKGRFFTMPDLIKRSVKENFEVKIFKIKEEWIDIGKKSELSRARGTFVE